MNTPFSGIYWVVGLISTCAMDLEEAFETGPSSIVQYLLNNDAVVNLLEECYGGSLFYRTSKRRHVSIVLLWLNNGDDVHLCDTFGRIIEALYTQHVKINSIALYSFLDQWCFVMLCDDIESNPLYIISDNGHVTDVFYANVMEEVQ